MIVRRCLCHIVRFSVNHYRLISDRRINPLGIQMLSSKLHEQLFSSVGEPVYSDENIEKSKVHLKQFELGLNNSEKLDDIELDLPKLEGKNLNEHFETIARQQSEPYVDLIHQLIQADIPQQPTQWKYVKGWTKYSKNDKETISVDYPDAKVMVFDVETLVCEGNFAVLAIALSPDHWYSWCSSRLIDDEEFRLKSNVELNDMIPMESNPEMPSLIVGHNVAFDRTYIKEQYQIESTAMRFLDTMSLHIMCSGFTHAQRIQYQAFEKGSVSRSNEKDDISAEDDLDEQYLSMLLASEKEKDFKAYARMRNMKNLRWKLESSLNNLVSVHKLYCKPKIPLSKAMQQVFITGNISDVRESFQNLMTYCANDVKATFEVIQKVYPMFEERFPHPVTLSGMLEMSRMFLPINNNWSRFIHEADRTYESIKSDIQHVLMQIANEACHQTIDQKYKKDPWLWDLDWSVQSMRFLKSSKPKPTKAKPEETVDNPIFKIAGNIWPTKTLTDDDPELVPSPAIQKILDTYSTLSKIQPHMPGYPSWYRELCMKQSKDDVNDEESPWKPGPHLISTKMRIVPKLLRLTWLGYPLHYDDEHGWGYLVPGLQIEQEEKEEAQNDFPYEAIKRVCEETKPFERSTTNMELQEIDDRLKNLEKEVEELEGKREGYRLMENLLREKEKLLAKRHKLLPTAGSYCPIHQGNGPYPISNAPGCWFFKIPHKDGNEKNVGNPLAKTFGSKIADGTLRAHESTAAKWLLEWSKMLSYWENNEKRIKSQMAVQIKDDGTAIILPRVVVAGTVTRRAVEPTWLTASNAQPDRIGSELKAMVQAPSGYCFVGADVDSQELWIASILADAQYAGIHGSTAFGWMNLQGKKKDGTDLHSKVANLVGIGRDQAKVFNYGRMYGAGKTFAEKLLMQFNHQLSVDEAKQKADLMYSKTKGIRDRKTNLWQGGSESQMFNSLEVIARSKTPQTPVLESRISRALEPHNVDDAYMTSRVNWVVQSSAVDYLHLMLVCMKWLIDKYNIRCRFVLSIHDEVRYMCHIDDRYRASLALQITNLLTRAMFASRLNMNDLPASVSFFSSVDVDQCLRKEPYMDCKTPSNPLGIEAAYDIPKGESLTIADIIALTDGQLDQQNTSTNDKK